MKRAKLVVVALLILVLPACAGLEESAADIRARIDAIDVRETLSGLTSCDALSDAFVGLVKRAATGIDDLNEVSGGRVPISDVREAVDELSVSQYFELAEKLGCARIQMQLQLADRILQIDTETLDGELLLEEVVKEIQLPSP